MEYRIDELARASGVMVRNIRYYQGCGMLPAPRRVGRVGIYDDAHLARLRLITRLLERNACCARSRAWSPSARRARPPSRWPDE